MIKILHVSAHMGGGVGNAISNLIGEFIKNYPDYEHTILLLEHPVHSQYIDKCSELGVKIIVLEELEKATSFVRCFDVVIINWWHHPIMFSFLSNLDSVEMRSIIWTHISGNKYPKLSKTLIYPFSKVFFTSKMAIDLFNNDLSTDQFNLYENMKLDDSNLLYGLGDYSELMNLEKNTHEGYRIGYIGTLSYVKMHPEYACFSKAAWEDDISFWMAGDKSEFETIQLDFSALGIKDSLIYCGYYSEVQLYFSEIDVLGYILNPQHYGTTENVIIEAMAAGIPVIALDQSVERYIIDHMETGILINNPAEYSNAVKKLRNDVTLRNTIIENARNKVIQEYGLDKNAKKMECTIKSLLENDKVKFGACKYLGKEPYEWFFKGLDISEKMYRDCMGNFVKDSIVNKDIKAKLYKLLLNKISELDYPDILLHETKSSIQHFRFYYPDDVILKTCQEIIIEIFKKKRSGHV